MIRIVFFGTSPFAVPALEKLATRSDIEIMLVVTRPDRPAGRGMKLSKSPIAEVADKLGLPVSKPKKVTELLTTHHSLLTSIDLIVLASYGKIIPEEILDLPKHGSLNIHPSLLPRYRGASPIQGAILDDAKETGVSIMKMVKEMDAGQIVATAPIKLTGNENYSELHALLAEIGAELLDAILTDYTRGKIILVEQNEKHATYTKLFSKTDYQLDLDKSGDEILKKIRAFYQPGAYTFINNKRIKIFHAELLSGEPLKNSLVLESGDGKKILLTEYQFEGKKRQKSQDR